MDRILNEVTIEIIQKCESNCIFCSSNSTIAANSEIPLEKITEIVDFCKAHGSKSINISGGEPLLHPRIVDIINTVKSRELKAVVYTSGNVSSDVWKTIFDRRLGNESVKFILNYPSCENEVYQKLIGSREFNINLLNEAIQRLVAESYEVEVHIVPNKINFHTLYDSSAHLKNIGVKKVSFLRLVPQGRADLNKDKLLLDQESLLNEIARIKNDLVDDSFAIRGGVPFSNLTKNKCECHAGLNKLIFRYDGVVFPCEAFKEAPQNSSFVLGSIHKNCLNEIWHNNTVHEDLRNLKTVANSKAEPCPAQVLFLGGNKK